MQHGQHNGQPSWDLVEILMDIRHDIGGLKVGQQMHLAEFREARRESREDINLVHRRIDRELRHTPKPEKRDWIASLGLSGAKEAVFLAAIVIGSLTGTLTLDKLLVALGEK